MISGRPIKIAAHLNRTGGQWGMPLSERRIHDVHLQLPLRFGQAGSRDLGRSGGELSSTVIAPHCRITQDVAYSASEFSLCD